MKRTKQHTTYETHFKHKLNMLEPGIAMCRLICALVALGIAFLLMPIKIIAFGLAGLTLLVLLLLLIIEAHHDNVLNEIAAQQRR
jgi:uncharacterized membrane-anchored protein YitT (DUF2179 family)